MLNHILKILIHRMGFLYGGVLRLRLINRYSPNFLFPYPNAAADPPQIRNLNNIKILKDKFKCRVGISDHSTDNRVAIAAIASGAEVIEKHIALDNQKKGFDIDFSLKGKEIKKCQELKKDQKSLYQIGLTVKKEITPFINIQAEETKKIIN